MTSQLEFYRRPQAEEYGEYYAGYVSKVEGSNIIEQFSTQLDLLKSVCGHISDDDASRPHEPYTWTIKQVFGHLIDAEKVFGYRAHRFAAGDKTELPGFDHTPYVENFDYSSVSLDELLNEFQSLRQGNLLFFERLQPENWDFSGTASGATCTVRALAYILVGHVEHHLDIVKKRIGFES